MKGCGLVVALLPSVGEALRPTLRAEKEKIEYKGNFALDRTSVSGSFRGNRFPHVGEHTVDACVSLAGSGEWGRRRVGSHSVETRKTSNSLRVSQRLADCQSSDKPLYFLEKRKRKGKERKNQHRKFPS